MDAGGRCHARDLLGECLGRQIDQPGALWKADGPQRAPMHRNDTIWVSAADHLCCLSGVEMALTKGRSPASDWHQSDVDVRYLVQSKVRTGVPRIPAPARAFDEIAERGSAMRTRRVPPAVVVGGQDAYLQSAGLHEVTRLDLPDLHTAGGDWHKQASRACWGDENRRGRDESQRGQVSVVSV